MSKPIRVLHVLAAMDRAGTENLIMSLYRNIDRTKVQFDFAVSANNECAFDEEIKSMGGRIYHYPRYCGTNHFYYVAWWKAFFKKHKEHCIVHGHIGSTAAIYLSIAKQFGKFAIAHSHNTNSKLSLSSVLYRIYSYRTRFIADYFFGCSKQALLDRYGKRVAHNRKVSSVLNNAIDTSKFAFNNENRKHIRNELGVNENEVIIGTVGRLTRQKNPDMIINIIKKLVSNGIKFRFLWVGTGELENEIKNKIHNLGLEDRVIFAGVRDDVYKVLMGMDIFVFPSEWEGLGISCVEAQASGLPTLCSEAVPIDAKVSNYFHQLLNYNVEEWCKKILALISTIKQNDRSNAYQQVKKNGYDIMATANQLREFYLKIARKSSGTH